MPLKSGRISDDSRIKESIPTIKYLLRNKARILIVSHLGRPEGKDKKFSLSPVANRLKKLLRVQVNFLPDILDPKVKEKIELQDPKEIFLFENIRFYEGEETNNFNFAQKMSLGADIYVNDAFPVSHRAHASIDAITRYLPSFCGLSFEKEIKELSKIKDNPTHPFVVIIGGAKVSDKIEVILNLAKKADYILIGGASANNLFKVEGYKLGDSIVDEKAFEESLKILKHASSKITLPIDVIVASSLNSNKYQIVDIPSIPSQICSSPFAIYDIGPKTIIKWEDIIKTAKTIFWSGPLGVFEHRIFSKGSREIAKAVSKNPNQTIIGGGDTISALSHFNIKKFSHISTAGSAMLQYISGEELPGVRALQRSPR